MTSDPNRSKPVFVGTFRRFSTIAALVVTGIGLLVLLGWMLDIALLKSIYPEYVSMKATTAMGFVMAGIALYLLHQKSSFRPALLTSRLLAVIMILLGLVVFLEYMTNLSTGLGTWVFSEDAHAPGTHTPGRMALNTALGFVFVGLALWLAGLKHAFAPTASQLLGLFVALLSFLPLLGYAFRVDRLYGIGDYTHMAIHTAVAFLLLGVGILFVRPDRGLASVLTDAGPGGFLSRRLLPMAIITPLVLVWLWVLAERSGWHALASDVSLFFVILFGVIVILIWKISDAVNQLEDRRKQSEDKAIEWHELMQYIIRHDPNAIAVHDKDLRYVYVSDRYLKDYQVREEDVIGKHHYEVFPDIPQKWKDVHQRALRGEVIRSEESAFPRADGRTDYTRWECRPWRNKQGETGGIILYTEVITESVEARLEVSRLNKRLLKLVSAVKNLSTAHDMKQVRESMATAARELADADGATFVFREGNNCYYAHEDAISPLWKGKRFPMDTCITGWVMQNKKQAVIHDIYEDDRIPHEAYQPTFVKSLAVFPINQDSPKATIGVYWARNYTPGEEERQILQSLADAAAIAMENVELLEELENRVEQRTEQLQSANRELESFSYSVSHDLRAPLRAIDGFTNILLEDHMPSLDEDGQRVCQVIKDNSHKMGRLIDDLLAFSRLSRKDLQHEHIDMSKLVWAIYHEATTPEDRERITFEVGELCNALGDTTMLRQVWANLISNAVKYSSKQEHPVIRVECSRKGGVCTYTIRDNGVGFDMKYVDKVFGVFQRLHSMREFEGTGVGLAIVQRVIHKHGGEVWAESEVGKGAVFGFSLPGSKK